MADEKKFIYNHARPYVAVNCVTLRVFPNRLGLYVFLEHKQDWDDKDTWGLPGGILRCSKDPKDEFGEENETIEECAERILTLNYELESRMWRIEGNKRQEEQIVRERKSVKLYDKSQFEDYDNWGLTPLRVLSEIKRDTRFRCIAIPFMLFCATSETIDTYDTKWVPINDILDGKIKFQFDDHAIMVKEAKERLAQMVRTQPIYKILLPPEFSIAEMINIYQSMLGITLDRSNFKKTMLERKLIEPANRSISNGRRPLELFRFNNAMYTHYMKEKNLAYNPSPKTTK
jgi:8-oxo-dGTP diphosphatase